jgi:hypothetical protein
MRKRSCSDSPARRAAEARIALGASNDQGETRTVVSTVKAMIASAPYARKGSRFVAFAWTER